MSVINRPPLKCLGRLPCVCHVGGEVLQRLRGVTLLDEEVIACIDDILIYTETEQEQVLLVQNVLQRL